MGENYTRIRVLGEGTWGTVFEATRRSDGIRTAVKRIKGLDAKSGLEFTALREIKFLQELKGCKYILQLLDVFLSDAVLNLVLELCPYDLEKVIRDKAIYLRSKHVKCYMHMLLKGLETIHDNFILHRDMKPSNILFSTDGEMRIADFGLARSHGSPVDMTAEVVTRWYRAPELLFGARFYSTGVDLWAAGCIFAEMLLRTPLFPGESDIEQLGKIFNALGTPTESSWPGVRYLPAFVEFEPRDARDLRRLFHTDQSDSNAAAHDLLLKLLSLNPLKRPTATEALAHPYFSSEPLACPPADLPVPTTAGGAIEGG